MSFNTTQVMSCSVTDRQGGRVRSSGPPSSQGARGQHFRPLCMNVFMMMSDNPNPYNLKIMQPSMRRRRLARQFPWNGLCAGSPYLLKRDELDLQLHMQVLLLHIACAAVAAVVFGLGKSGRAWRMLHSRHP